MSTPEIRWPTEAAIKAGAYARAEARYGPKRLPSGRMWAEATLELCKEAVANAAVRNDHDDNE